ncbi:uncharacterized protein LOC115808809 [Chanos chanos]|uniref:Uncharacterized protein LOC115808809 n=1 Tax=Chanos chanos TaxID=29144 RepID=A0A6J2V4L1_CHACN|nr:uncharacterized protein LOC115808809 [Chanos chanos]
MVLGWTKTLGFLALAQGKPEVTLFPPFKRVYVGDEIQLNCKGASGPVKWYISDKEQSGAGPVLHIPMATLANSGSYVCENGERSGVKDLTVLDSLPPASLSIKMGFPVMSGGDGVVVELTVDDGLADWWCVIARGTDPKNITVNRSNRDMFTDDHYTVTLHFDLNHADRAMVWCVKKSTTKRSNAITLRKTGETVALRCVVYGIRQTDQVTFYKNNNELVTSKDPKFTISNVTQGNEGDYSCKVDYTNKSDPQPLRVIVSSNQLTCSCPWCPEKVQFHWYEHGEKLPSSPPGKTMTVTDEKKEYTCRAVWDDGMSLMSQYSAAGLGPERGFNIMVLAVVLLILG